VTGTYDIAVVGSGFAGSVMAMILRRLGRSVVLLEKGAHPRFVVGESSTPLSNLLLEELSTRFDLPEVRPLAKWGTWQQTHPGIACGRKRGFTFYHHRLGQPDPPDRDRQNQLLVAASPRDEIADTHWFRPDFDHFLVRAAQQLGVDYLEHANLKHVIEESDHLQLQGGPGGEPLQIRARFVIDASGARGFLHSALSLGERELPGCPPAQALYSHFSGVRRIADGQGGASRETPPYPVDDAAVHHIFDGGWVWVLLFNNGIASAGVAAVDAVAAQLRLGEGEPAWNRLLDLIPSLREQFSAAAAVQPFRHIPRLRFCSARIAGHRWALLPSAAGFVDPLLSTGFPLALLGVARLTEIFEHNWDSPHLASRLQSYSAQTNRELLAAARLIAALYATMNNFPVFTALTLLYFAAVSYSEAARRLGKAHLAASFLLCDHPGFGPAFTRICEQAQHPLTATESADLLREIAATLEPINVAGLGRPERHNWYPVETDDLLDKAAKLGATREEVRQMLHRCGFQP